MKILIADDHPMIRTAIEVLLRDTGLFNTALQALGIDGDPTAQPWSLADPDVVRATLTDFDPNCGDGIVEGRDVADVRPQSSVPHPLDDLTQLGTIGLDNEVDR